MKFLIDTDVASDDAVALIMALRSPAVQVVAITTVAGNVDVAQASRNALYTAELCGSNVPVFTGAAKPLTRPHVSADWFHGRDGLGDHGYAAPHRAPEQQNATDAIIETIDSHPGLGDRHARAADKYRAGFTEEAGHRGKREPLRGYGRRAML